MRISLFALILIFNFLILAQVSRPYDFFQGTLGNINRGLQESNETSWENIRRLEQIREMRRKETKQATKEIVNLYYSFEKFPNTIEDGWHEIIMTNNDDNYGIRKVYVSNNKITKYLNGNNDYITIKFSTNISNGKTSLTIGQYGNKDQIVDIYFFESIAKENN